jgi:hypothetical protein
LTDPSGNSYISTEIIGANDPNLKQISYMRKTEDFVAMGYNVDQAEIER